MSKYKCIVRQIRDYSENKGEIYAFINVLEKKVYVGETGDGESRELTHAKCIFGLEEGSNANLVDENQNNSYCLLYLFSLPKKSKNDTTWIALETIYMYLFVKHGFQLYNSNNGRDNCGKERKFLTDSGLSMDILYQKVIALLNKYPVIEHFRDESLEDEEYTVSSWEELLEIAERTFLQDIYNTFQCNIWDIVGCENRTELWANFVKSKQGDKDYIILENMKDESDFFVFNKQRLESLVENSVIKSISLRNLLEQGKLNHIIYSKVGDYLGESVYQILQNKLLDLQHGVSLPILCGEGSACFWSLAGAQEDWIRKELGEKEGHNEIYMILSYTGSKKLSEKIFEGRKAIQYSLDRKKATEKYQYPSEYKDEWISNRKSMSFLISELYYVEEDVTGCIIEKTYTALFESADPRKINAGCRQKSFVLAELREEDKDELLSVLTEADINSNKTGLLIAKLTYPFVVAV